MTGPGNFQNDPDDLESPEVPPKGSRPLPDAHTPTAPLDAILGTVAAVRVLRILCDGDAHAPPSIARQTGVSRPAVREAIIRLEQQEIVERVGQGRNILYRLARSHPLTKRVVKLFKAERKRRG